VTSASHRGGLQHICEHNIFQGYLLRFGFFDLYGYWGTRLFSYFGDIFNG
jgi:hypothetical protein